MSQPTPYNRVFSFTNDQTANPSTKTPGNQLDSEYNAVLTTISQILANLVLIQRDDGQLANQTVGAAQLKPEITTGVQPSTIWATAASYGVNATVFNGLKLYRCLVAHISGTFATDLAAGDWTLLADFSTAIAAVSGVTSIGGQSGAMTIPGGGIGSTVLPVARYDAAQTLLAAQQLQLANNMLSPSGAGAQTLTSGQMAQITTNIGAAAIANNLSDLADKNAALVNVTGGSPTATQQNSAQKGLGLPAIMRSYLAGLTLSTAGSSATFSVAAGVASDSTNADMLTLAASLSKTTSAWAVGTGNGALDTSTIANSQWYHVWLIKRIDTQVVDVLISLSVSSPTMPTNYTLKRRIGSVLTNSSGQFVLFHQNGDEFLWDARVNAANGSAFSATAALLTTTVPPGLQVNALVFLRADYATNGANLLLSSPDESDQSPINTTSSLGVSSTATVATGTFNVRTDTSGRVRLRASTTGPTYILTTNGWIDRRGRDA